MLATDCARGIDHPDIVWADLFAQSDEGLSDLLRDLHQWEAQNDPTVCSSLG